MVSDKVYSGAQDKEVERTVWIIDCFLDIVKVRAKFSRERMAWSYEDAKTGNFASTLKPYNPNLTGSSSFWGDGYHYRTKKAAKADQEKLIKRKIKDIRKEYRDRANYKIEQLKEKL